MRVLVCDRCKRDTATVPQVTMKNPDGLNAMRLSRADFTLPDGTRIDLCAECFAQSVTWIRKGV